MAGTRVAAATGGGPEGFARTGGSSPTRTTVAGVRHPGAREVAEAPARPAAEVVGPGSHGPLRAASRSHPPAPPLRSQTLKEPLAAVSEARPLPDGTDDASLIGAEACAPRPVAERAGSILAVVTRGRA